MGCFNAIRNRGHSTMCLSIPQQHQLRVARATLKMSNIGAMIMGGPTKEEARQIIKRLTGQEATE